MLLQNLDGSIGGAQRQAGLLAREVARRGWRVVVVNQSAEPLTRRGAVAGDGVERIALPLLGWLPRSSFFLAFLLWATANRRRFQVIHAHSTAAGLTAGLVGRLLGKRTVVKVTGMQAAAALADRGPTWRLRRWVLDRTADVVVAVSMEMMQALSEAGIGAERRVLIANGVDLPEPAVDGQEATKTEWLGDASGPVVLYVGRLEEVKGVKRLLAMWTAMPRRHAATLAIVGDGPLRAGLEREAAARGLGDSVRFLGSHRDVNTFYLMADVFVLPSTSEGFSNALLEAMAAGLPAVAANVGGNCDVVEHGVSGFLVDWRDPGAAAESVTRLLDDAALRQRIGAAARGRAGGFSMAAVGERYCGLYRDVVARAMAPHEAVR